MRVVGLFVILLMLVTAFYNKKTGPAKHVVYIGVDAMSPDGILNAHTPTLDSLLANGTYTLRARGVIPTVSSVNWFTMISGATPEQSGVTGNAWRKDNHILPATYHGAEQMFPTILSVIRDAMPKAEIGVIYHWEGFNNLFERSVPNFDATFPTEEETATQAAKYIVSKKPTFTFINIDHVDIVGHKDGHGTPEFYASISKADSLIGIVMNAIRSAGIADETVVIITADHGGIKYGHGGETIQELEIPLIVAGKGVKSRHRIERPVNLYDIPATALYALGIETPIYWSGKPIHDAFVGHSSPSLGFNNLIATPTARPAGGAYKFATPPIELYTLSKGAEVRYTTDGSEPSENSTLYHEPFIVNATTQIKARTFRNGQASTIATYNYSVIPASEGHGVSVSYLSFMDSFNRNGATEGINLIEQKTDTVLQVNLLDIEMGESPAYVLRFASNLYIDQSDDYTFYLSSANPSLLFINGEPVLKNNGRYNTKQEEVSLSLSAGFHSIEVMYYSLIYGKTLKVEYSSPRITRGEIPANKLYLAQKTL